MENHSMEAWTVYMLGNALSGRSSFARCLAGVDLPSPGKVTGIEQQAPIKLEVDGKPCFLELKEIPARNASSGYQPLTHQQYKQAHGFFIVCAVTEPSGIEHTQQAVSEIRRALESTSSERKTSSTDGMILSSKDPIRDVAIAIVATKWDLEHERGHPSYALQNIANGLKKPCIEVSAKFNVNIRLAAETMVRMLRVKHNKVAIKQSKSSENLLSLGSQPGFGNFWKRKLKFKQIDWNEYWRFCDINPTSVDLTQRQTSDLIRAVILNDPAAIPDVLAAMHSPSSKLTSDASGHSAALFDSFSALHVASILGRVDCAQTLMDSVANLQTKDSFGKTPLFRAARNGQLRMLPVFLRSATKTDPTVVEALRIAFAPAILQYYDVDGLTSIFSDVVHCGFDLDGIGQELEKLHSFLSKTGGVMSTNSNLISHISKGIAAIKLAHQADGLAGSHDGALAMNKLALGMLHNSKSSEKLGSPKKATPASPRKAAKPEFDPAKELGLSADTFEPKKDNSSGFKLRGYFSELAQSLQSTVQPLNVELQLRVVQQIAEAIGLSSPATRFEVSKLIAQPLIQSLVQTTNRLHTYGIIKLMNSLMVDNDRASSLFGAEGAIAPLIATMVSAGDQHSSSPTSNSLRVSTEAPTSDSWDPQAAAAIALNSVASCNSKNKELVNNANGISACLLLLSENYRSREKLFLAVMKLLATLVSNPGISAIFCDAREHPESLPTLMSLIRNADRPFLIRRGGLRVLSELCAHAEAHQFLLSGGCDSNLFITVLNSAKANSLANDSITPPVLCCISRLSVSDSWAKQYGVTVLPLLLECLQGITTRKVKTLAYAADLYRRFNQIDAARPILASAATRPNSTSRWTLSPSPALQDAAFIGLGDVGMDLKLSQQIESLCSQLQSTSTDQAAKAALQLAEIVQREGPPAKRAILERNGFASLWKLLLQNRIHWQGDWLVKVDSNNLEFKERVGHGAFGSVYSGLLTTISPKSRRKETLPVAIKTIEEEQLQLDDFKSELITLSLVTGVVKNVVEFRGYSFFQQTNTGKISTTKTYHCVVMELMETTLEKIIFNSKKKIKIKKTKEIAYGIAKGMSELHHFNILHRDLKPANILLNTKKSSVSGRMDVKIADLGYARRDTADSIRKSVVGTPTYLAPELFLDLRGKSLEVTKAADVYSFGILLYELVTRKRALDGIDAARIAVMMHEARQQGPRPTLLFPMEEDADSTLRALILSCLSFDPLARPSFEKICLVLEEDLSRDA